MGNKRRPINHWVYSDGRWQVTARFIGGDSNTNLINGAKGFLVGVPFTLLMVWLWRYKKRRRVQKVSLSSNST